jgi:hypothetical protein
MNLLDLIIKLLIDLLKLAYNRDINNPLLPFTSKEFFLEVTHLCCNRVTVRKNNSNNSFLFSSKLIIEK